MATGSWGLRSARSAPIIGGDPIHVEDDTFTQNGWGVFVSSYVFDNSSASLPGSFALDPGEMLFVYLLDGDNSKAVSVDTFSVGNAFAAPIKSVGWNTTVVPAGFNPADFQDPFSFGFNGPSQSTVYLFGNNFLDPFSTLDPDEYSVVWYVAEATTWTPVSASVTGAGEAASQFVPGPLPEPATLSLLAVGAVALLRRRRRECCLDRSVS